MTVREWVIKAFRKVGGAFLGTVHDRMIVQEETLYRLGSQLDHLNSSINSQSQNLAENQGALLQGSNHTIESLQRSQRVLIEQVDILVRVETGSREIRAALAEFMMSADRTANAQLSIFQSRIDQIQESLHAQTRSLLETFADSSSKQLEVLHDVLARLDSSERAIGSQQLMLQSRMDQIGQSVSCGMGSVLEKIGQLSSNQVELMQGVLARLDSSERAVSSQQSMLQLRMDQVDESVRSLIDSVFQKIEQSSTQHLELIQGVLARLDSSELAVGLQQSMLQSRMDQVDESINSRIASVLDKIEHSSAHQFERLQNVVARLDSAERAAGLQQSVLQSRMDEINQSVSSHVGSVLERIEHSSAHQLEILQSVVARLDSSERTAGLQQSRMSEIEQSVSSNMGFVLEKIEHSSARQLEVTESVLASMNSSASAERQVETIAALGNLRNYISERADHLTTAFENEVVQQVCIETTDFRLTNPEIGLISFLYSYLPNRKVIDVGAHVGEFSEALLNVGYEVYAFEPFRAVYEQLVGRLAGRDRFHPFQLALGSSEGEMCLHSATDATSSNVYGDATVFNTLKPHGMPDGLQFTGSTNVPVRTLDNLHAEGLVPQDVGLVKIDTEGFDLEVIRGMEEHRYPMVAAEYWDSEIPFAKSGLLYTLDRLVEEMKSRGYFWYVTLFRIWGRNQIGYYCNHDRSVPNSWGNVVFFRDHALFSQAQMWCSAVLPRVYFKPYVKNLSLTNAP